MHGCGCLQIVHALSAEDDEAHRRSVVVRGVEGPQRLTQRDAALQRPGLAAALCAHALLAAALRASLDGTALRAVAQRGQTPRAKLRHRNTATRGHASSVVAPEGACKQPPPGVVQGLVYRALNHEPRAGQLSVRWRRLRAPAIAACTGCTGPLAHTHRHKDC